VVDQLQVQLVVLPDKHLVLVEVQRALQLEQLSLLLLQVLLESDQQPLAQDALRLLQNQSQVVEVEHLAHEQHDLEGNCKTLDVLLEALLYASLPAADRLELRPQLGNEQAVHALLNEREDLHHRRVLEEVEVVRNRLREVEAFVVVRPQRLHQYLLGPRQRRVLAQQAELPDPRKEDDDALEEFLQLASCQSLLRARRPRRTVERSARPKAGST